MTENYSYTASQTNTFLFDTPKKTNILDGEHTDHLGNVRVTFKNIGSAEEPEIETTSWTDYYPFGEAMPSRSLSSCLSLAFVAASLLSEGVNSFQNVTKTKKAERLLFSFF